MHNSLISVIVPVYNVEKYLNKCIDSILDQTYCNLEIILVDDGSPDLCPEICDEYAEKDDRIKVIHKINEGVSFARNAALAVASGEYIVFVDSDDWIDLDTCEIALTYAEQFDCDIVMWSYMREFTNNSLRKNIFDKEIIVFEKDDVAEQLWRRILGPIDDQLRHPENLDCISPVFGKLYRSNIIRENDINFVDIRQIGTCEDGIFNLQVFKYIERAVFITLPLYHYRKDNDTSLTTIYKENLSAQWMILFDLMEAYITENNLNELYSQALNNRISLSILGLGLNILNSGNGTCWKVREIKRIISQTRFEKAYKTLKLQCLPLHWKCFYGCAKYDFATGVYLILCVIKKMIGRK